MKKVVALGCSMLMVASVLAGCGGGKDAGSGDKRVVKFDSFSGGNGQEVFTEMEKAFEEKYKDIDVQLRFEKDLDQVLNKENAKGEYSDVVYYNLGQKSQYLETQLNTGEVMDISDVFKNLDGKIDPAYAENAVVDYYGTGKGKYLLPLKTTPAGFFYNTNLIGEGKKYALPTTWDEMWALGEQARADGTSLFTYPTQGYFDNTLMAMLAESGGLEFFTKAMQYSDNTWESAEGRRVLDTIAKLVSSENLFADTVSNALTKDAFTKNQQAVINGDALFMPNGDWIVGEMAETTPEEFHWGLMALPAYEAGGDRYVSSMTEQIWIPKQAKNSEDAKKFLEFIYSEEGAEIMLKHGNVVPTVNFSEKVDGLSDEGYTKQFFGVYKEAKSVLGAFGAYDSTNTQSINLKDVVFGTINEVATGTKSVDEWQSLLVETWKTLKANPLTK